MDVTQYGLFLFLFHYIQMKIQKYDKRIRQKVILNKKGYCGIMKKIKVVIIQLLYILYYIRIINSISEYIYFRFLSYYKIMYKIVYKIMFM